MSLDGGGPDRVSHRAAPSFSPACPAPQPRRQSSRNCLLRRVMRRFAGSVHPASCRPVRSLHSEGSGR